MINLTASYIVPEDFFNGDWMVTTLPSLTLKQKTLISSILDKLLTVDSNFNKEQIDVINEYWDSMSDEVILCAAYRAGLYSAEHTTEEDLLLHACKYIVNFLGDGDGSEEFLFEGKFNDFLMLIKEAEWLLAADVVSKEVYSRIIMRMVSENHDLAGLIEDVLGFEVGLSDETFFSKLNAIGDAVVGRLLGLDCAIYSELPKKNYEATVTKKKEEEQVDEMNEYYEKEKTNKSSMTDDEVILCGALSVSTGKGYYEAKFRKEEEGGERESLTLTHLLNNDDTGGDDVYLATLDERKCQGDTCGFESERNVLSSFKLKESVLQLPDQSNKKKSMSQIVGVEVASVFIAVASVFELIMGLIAIASKSKVFRGKGYRRTARSGSRNWLDRTDNIAAKTIYSLLIFLAVSSNPFVDGGFVWTSGYKDGYNYKDYCIAGGSDNTRRSCVCLNGSTYTRPSSGAGSTGYSYYICTSVCDRYPFRADGYCGQCAAGYFFGSYYSSTSSGTECSDDNLTPSSSCECIITTYSQQNVEEKFDFFFTCSHDAENFVNHGDYEHTSCHECPAGTYSNQGDIVCSACPVGTYTNTAGTPNSCNRCPVGTYTDKTGTTECTQCRAGTFNGNDGSTREADCLECQPGYYSSSPGSKECTRCGAGTYTDTLGATSCKQAEPGHYVGSTKTANAQTAQYVCPVGSYAEKLEGSTKCISCPIGKSTNDVGKTSSADCIECPYGVDSHTYACLTQTEGTSMTNLCWDVGQLLGMDASSAVQDLHSRVYSLPEHGMNDMIRNTMSFIEQVANGGVLSFESMNSGVSALLDQLQNAPNAWLEGASDSYQGCIDETSSGIDGTVTSASALYYNTDMFSYQFGSNFMSNREKWIAHWKCSGATFGCVNSGDNPCPVVTKCFNALYKSFASLLTGPGGATFGNYPASNMGRYTPGYGPTYFETELLPNVKSLANWENTEKTFALYESVIKEIQQMGNEIEGLIVNATDAILQVENVRTAANLETSLTSGDLYYDQVEYNYQKTIDLAEIVQWGPAYCPEGYEIQPGGIPDECTPIDTLVQECKEFIIGKLVVKGTVSLAKKIAAAGARRRRLQDWTEAIDELSNSFNHMSNIMSTSDELLNYYACDGMLEYDPETQLPQYPPDKQDSVSAECMEALYKWYINGQQTLSAYLVEWSPAMWQNIYLENYARIEPTLEKPPVCFVLKKRILSAFSVYLANVQSMTNFGNAMTTSAMSLAPKMGNIATYLATLYAIETANQAIVVPPSSIDPAIITAPTEYQDVHNELFYFSYRNASKTIVAYSPAASLALQQYTAAKSLFGFCASYSYMNAGRPYNENGGDCSSFGDYLPTYTTFQDTVNSFLPDSAAFYAPISVKTLNSKLETFADGLASNPTIQGTTREADQLEVKSFSIEIPLDVYGFPKIPQVYGDLNETASIRFSLTAGSDLMFQDRDPFTVAYVNPDVVSVQVFLRGVRYNPAVGNPNLWITFRVNPSNPYMVYHENTGVAVPYHLPDYDVTDSSFATFQSLQATDNECGNLSNQQVRNVWMDGEKPLFCTPYNTDFSLPSPNLAEEAFLFPSLFGTWTVDIPNFNPNSQYYTVNETELALQVMFQYGKSQTTSSDSTGSASCARGCGLNLASGAGVSENPSALVNSQWCDNTDCTECVASHVFYNGTELLTDEFCACNVWTGTSVTCNIYTLDSDTFTVTTVVVTEDSGGSSTDTSRLLRKKKSESSGTKSGKSEVDVDEDSVSSLSFVLQDHLAECGGNVQDAVTVKEECKSSIKGKGGETKMVCDYHVMVTTTNENRSLQLTNDLNDCISRVLSDSPVVEEIAVSTEACEVDIKMGKRKLRKFNKCLFD